MASSNSCKEYYSTIEKLLEYLDDKKEVRLQLVAYTQDTNGDTETQVFYFNSDVRDMLAAAGILQMLGTFSMWMKMGSLKRSERLPGKPVPTVVSKKPASGAFSDGQESIWTHRCASGKSHTKERRIKAWKD